MVATHVKGSVWRRKVCVWLEALGYSATFRSIGVQGDDITSTVGKVDLSIEAKNHKSHDFSGWLTQAQGNAPIGSVPIVIAHRRGRSSVDDCFVVMTGSALAQLLSAIEGARS